MGYEPLELCREGKRSIFYRPAKWLWDRQERYRALHPHGAQDGSEETLTLLYGEKAAKEYYRRYRIRKNEKLMMVFAAGMAAAAALTVFGWWQARDSAVKSLEKPAPTEGSRQYEMNVAMEGERLTGILVEVPAGQLTRKERKEALRRAQAELDALVESWNPDGVDGNLPFPDRLQGGLVDVRFESNSYDLLDGTGHVRNALTEEAGRMVELRAVMCCGDDMAEAVYPIRIIPKGQDTASRLARETARQLREEETQEESKIFVLPEEFEGKTLSWELAQPSYGMWIVALTVAGCFLLNFAFENDMKKEGEKRREEMLLSYPSFLSRMTLLVGTGMPVRMVFMRLAKEAERKGASPVYEEVLRTCREMESGIAELEAYENFGKRCKLPQYKKCASLLSQNVRKGSGGLLAALNQEAANAFEERKAAARRKGEEAQTRMLLPMLMMLVVVMILVMVPACFSFGGL